MEMILMEFEQPSANIEQKMHKADG